MSSSESSFYPSYAAPAQSGEILLSPSLGQAVDALEQTAIPEHYQYGGPSFGTATFEQFRQAARAQAVGLAVQYTTSYSDLPYSAVIDDAHSIVMGGHQPDLFHCGVWFKNWILSELARRGKAIAIHFIVDNDLCRQPGIQIPTWSEEHVKSRLVTFDESISPMPWENRKLVDHSLWHSFSDRTLKAVIPLKSTPLIAQLWKHAVGLDLQGASLGELLSQARHLLEQELGLRTLEVPLSHLCRTDKFAQFSLSLFQQGQLLHQLYNRELDNFREAHRIRNHAQPLPNLVSDGEWWEMPWWCYHRESSQRRPLWIKHDGKRIQLSDRNGWQVEIQTRDIESGSAVQQWLDIEAREFCIRPRALITTLYVRTILCDQFVHGIGGARYDQITDRLVAGLWGIRPPAFVVASATLRLEFAELPQRFKQPMGPTLESARIRLNSIKANPERLLESLDVQLDNDQRRELTVAAQRKLELLNKMPVKGEKWEWHVAMKKAKHTLDGLAKPHLQQLESNLQRLEVMQAEQQLLESREYSFCLFNREQIEACFGNPR
jgi:hypothetical protein